MTPASARIECVTKATPGVGSGPVKITSPPCEQTPDEKAISSI